MVCVLQPDTETLALDLLWRKINVQYATMSEWMSEQNETLKCT